MAGQYGWQARGNRLVTSALARREDGASPIPTARGEPRPLFLPDCCANAEAAVTRSTSGAKLNSPGVGSTSSHLSITVCDRM